MIRFGRIPFKIAKLVVHVSESDNHNLPHISVSRDDGGVSIDHLANNVSVPLISN